MKDSTTFQKTFTICRYHEYFLEKEGNASKKLRDILDNAMDSGVKKNTRIMLDRLLTYAAFGLIIMLVGLMVLDPLAKIASFAIGIFLFAYGIIGGINHILRLSKARK